MAQLKFSSEALNQALDRMSRGERRYVCKKRWRKLKQRGRKLFKDFMGYYWIKFPEIHFLPNDFNGARWVDRDTYSLSQKCVICEHGDIPRLNLHGVALGEIPVMLSVSTSGKSSLGKLLAIKERPVIYEHMHQLSSQRDFKIEPMLGGAAYTIVNPDDHK